MPTPSEILAGRINRELWPAHVTKICDAALAASDAARKNATSTKQGDYSTLRGLHRSDVTPKIGSAKRQIEKAKADLAKRKATIRDKALEHETPRDSRLASEVRSALRAMPLADRVRLLTADKIDLGTLRSVLEAPAYLTGVEGDLRSKVEERFLIQAVPNDYGACYQTERAIEHAEACVEMAISEVRTSTNFPNESAFQGWLGENSTTQAEAQAMYDKAQQEARDAERQAWIAKNVEKLGTAAA